MKTALMNPDSPFDINKVPIWAVPQLRRLMGLTGWTVVEFEILCIDRVESVGEVIVRIEGDGCYWGSLYKSDMTKCPHPVLYLQEEL